MGLCLGILHRCHFNVNGVKLDRPLLHSIFIAGDSDGSAHGSAAATGSAGMRPIVWNETGSHAHAFSSHWACHNNCYGPKALHRHLNWGSHLQQAEGRPATGNTDPEQSFESRTPTAAVFMRTSGVCATVNVTSCYPAWWTGSH